LFIHLSLNLHHKTRVFTCTTMDKFASSPSLPRITYNGVSLVGWELERNSEDMWDLLDVPPCIANMRIKAHVREWSLFPDPVPGTCFVTLDGKELDDTLCDFSTESITDKGDGHQEGLFVYANFKWHGQYWDFIIVATFPYYASQRLRDGYVRSFNLCRITNN
jgi:hypothetical protein